MLAEQFTAAINAARTTIALDDIVRLSWKANVEGHIADADAHAIAEAVQARRAALARPPTGTAFAAAMPALARRLRPRKPEQIERIHRRRRCAASGAVPARIAAAFTQAEVAALAIVAAQVREHGQCLLPLATIAERAGVSKSTVKNAIRHAIRLGLIERTERRIRHQRSETNILRVISPEWMAWLRHGRSGGKPLPPKDNISSFRQRNGENCRPGEARKSLLGVREARERTSSARPGASG